jgi:RNA polymerase sigma-70 factor (ECF subfamily)
MTVAAMEASLEASDTRADFERRLRTLRPKLHRYCARMTGSVIDGEDAVQDALVKAIEAFPKLASVENLEAWLFRIAHNAALDCLRRRARREAGRSDEDVAMIAEPSSRTDERIAAAASLRTFMRLPVGQRSSVILMDVLGYSLEEVGGVLDASIPSVKANLHRGRARLRELAKEPDDRPLPVLRAPERSLLGAYIDRFNARDFDAIRDMLAEEVRLDLVARTRMNGRAEVATYFGNYADKLDWRLALGLVEGRPAVLVSDPDDREGRPLYFVLLGWRGNKLLAIRDFRYARYAMEGAEFSILG